MRKTVEDGSAIFFWQKHRPDSKIETVNVKINNSKFKHVVECGGQCPPYAHPPLASHFRNAMNNPFANFDLEESLSGLPGVLRQPMVLAVAASGLVHGLFFLVLPVVTNSAESKKLPDRIVNVIELTPEQQANLPPSMMVNQLPLNQTPLLPTTPGGKLPLTSLFPGSVPNSTITVPPSKNPIDSYIEDSLRNSQNSITSNSYFDPLPPVRISRSEPEVVKEKPPAKPPEKTPEQKADDKLKTQLNLEEPADQPKDKPKDKPPGPGTTVEPNQPTTPPSSTLPPPGTPTDSGAKVLTPTTPAALTPEQQNLFTLARTFNPKGTSSDDYKGKVNGEFLPKVIQTSGKAVDELYAAYPNKTSQSFPANPVPADWQLNFTNVPKDQKYVTVIEAYVKADGSFAFDPQVTRSSGFGLLDEQSLKLLAEYLKKEKPNLGKDQFVEFVFPFVQNAPA
jgi:hypothetical protein